MKHVKCTATYCEHNAGLLCNKDDIQILYYEEQDGWQMTKCNDYKQKVEEHSKDLQITALKDYVKDLENVNTELRYQLIQSETTLTLLSQWISNLSKSKEEYAKEMDELWDDALERIREAQRRINKL